MAINYRKCPKCGSRNVIKILYGEPTGEALFMKAQGKIKLGGCLITIYHTKRSNIYTSNNVRIIK